MEPAPLGWSGGGSEIVLSRSEPDLNKTWWAYFIDRQHIFLYMSRKAVERKSNITFWVNMVQNYCFSRISKHCEGSSPQKSIIANEREREFFIRILNWKWRFYYSKKLIWTKATITRRIREIKDVIWRVCDGCLYCPVILQNLVIRSSQ